MKITEIRIHLMGEDRLKAFASVTFDDAFVVRNMKVVEGTKGLFLCMPSRKLPDGTHKYYLEEGLVKTLFFYRRITACRTRPKGPTDR